MKSETHPDYEQVVFHDTSQDTYFLIGSTIKTEKTIEYKGSTYPYVPLDISSASHPFYTGQQRMVDTAGRVDRFRKKYAKKSAPKSTADENADAEK